MCGIFGSVTRTPFREDEIRFANNAVRHRGPDDGGFDRFESGSWCIAMGNRRLSIIDLSMRGHQPMTDKSSESRIVYNGETYNFHDVRKQLEDCGHKFLSDTDTEVVLKSYVEWGPECLKRLNGMFAFAVWDERRKSLFIARDRLGVKPLYYTRIGDGLAFASEIKSLLWLPGVRRRMNVGALAKYLSFLWVPDPETLLEGIYKLPPGHYAVFENGKLDIHVYWDIELSRAAGAVSENDAIEEVTARLRKSVRSRLVSDVPVGVFLSGGLDSSLITAIMTETVDKPIVACSVGFGADISYDIAPDDLKYARRVRDCFSERLDFREIVLDPEIVNLLPETVWHLDEPVADPAALSTYLICRAAKGTASVMLSGVGGEEVFGGYPRYLAMKLAGYLEYGSPVIRSRAFSNLLDRLPASRPGPFLAYFRNFKKFARAVRERDFQLRYLAMRAYYSPGELRALLTTPHLADQALEEHLDCFDRVKGLDPLAQLLYVDSKTFLPNLNLAYTDKMSMAASVEIREPLLDYELVQFVTNLPSTYKIRGRKQKYILKKIGERFLPRDVVWRKKSGFGAPIRAWVTKDLEPVINDLLSRESVMQRGLFNYSFVQKLLADQHSGTEDNAFRIWALLTLELWMRTFLDSDGRQPISVDYPLTTTPAVCSV
jgi:asparagine synthase (glutamine-hydrolysing)